ncbi:MAG TPA: alpha/beta family hydrolase [Bryobacteraceae bacterium]|nr:alpha/beta family hydrolase [Bryobacteraceae bacterium]
METIVQEGIRGFLHEAEGEQRGALVLTHGAGANCQTALLIAVSDAFAKNGFGVLRCDLAFRQRRPHGPPSPSTGAGDRAGLRTAVSFLRGRVDGPIVLGGHSYGGRQATILASEEPAVAEALLLLSYPLHPPDKPAQLRTAHFPELRTPALFVSGTKDPFGSPEELRAALAALPGRYELRLIENAGHDLKRPAFDWGAVVVETIGLISGS